MKLFVHCGKNKKVVLTCPNLLEDVKPWIPLTSGTLVEMVQAALYAPHLHSWSLVASAHSMLLLLRRLLGALECLQWAM